MGCRTYFPLCIINKIGIDQVIKIGYKSVIFDILHIINYSYLSKKLQTIYGQIQLHNESKTFKVPGEINNFLL